jgi:hypothetical protein
MQTQKNTLGRSRWIELLTSGPCVLHDNLTTLIKLTRSHTTKATKSGTTSELAAIEREKVRAFNSLSYTCDERDPAQ